MPLRYVNDFDDQQWAQLQKALKAGPTKKQQEFVKRAMERGRKIKRGDRTELIDIINDKFDEINCRLNKMQDSIDTIKTLTVCMSNNNI